MEVPLLDLGAQYQTLEQELQAAVVNALASTQYINGPPVAEFEAAMAAYCGTAEAVALSSGTDALLAALMALGVGPGDTVLVPPYSFFATAGGVARLGATPAFVDIDPVTYNVSAHNLLAWFDDPGHARIRPAAVIPVHLYGQCADMDAIRSVAETYGAAVIEDAAQAVGATYPGEGGTIKAGAAGLCGCFSFFPTKNLGGVGEGGLVTTNDAAFADTLRMLRNHGSAKRYYHPIIGGNFRLDSIKAAALLVKLKHLDEWNEARRQNAAYYDAGFEGSDIEPPACAYGREHHTYHQYVIRVPEGRDDLRAYLAEHGVGNEVYYPVPFHLQECFQYLGYREGDFPMSEDAARRTVALPVHPHLTREMQDHVIACVRKFYE